MPSIFSAAPGTVMAISPPPDAADKPTTMFKIEIGDANKQGTWGPDSGGISGIVTGFSVTGDTNVQFTQTLRDAIYLTAFGHKMGGMTLSGMLFLNNPIICKDGSASGGAPLEPFFKKFRDNNVIERKNPLLIVLANTNTIKAFLLSYQIQVMDAQFQIGQFTMQFAVIPEIMNDARGS